MSTFFNLAEWIPRWTKGESGHSHAFDAVDAERAVFDDSFDPFGPGSEAAPESLENFPGSPTGSRASSIAGDRNVLLLPSRMAPYKFGTPLLYSSKAGSLSRSWHTYSKSLSIKVDSDEDLWETGALSRPMAEPPILDYRKFEEGGRMYDSLHRHPDTNPEQWYAYTDPEIERELLDDYHDFTIHAQAEAHDAGDWDREDFYAGLRSELDIDRGETGCDFGEVKERMYWQQRKRKSVPKRAGHRVQEQFDPVRKRWFDVDSMDSKWDEQEWEIFGNAPEERSQTERFANLTEENLRKNRRNLSFAEAVPEIRKVGKKANIPPSSALEAVLRSSFANGPINKLPSSRIPLCKMWLSNGPLQGKATTQISYRQSSELEVSHEYISAKNRLSLVLNC